MNPSLVASKYTVVGGIPNIKHSPFMQVKYNTSNNNGSYHHRSLNFLNSSTYMKITPTLYDCLKIKF